jgi:hypothetical protein
MLQHLYIWPNSTIQHMHHDIVHGSTISIVTNMNADDLLKLLELQRLWSKQICNSRWNMVEQAGHANMTS